MCVHNVSQRGKPRILRTLCTQLGQRDERHGQMRVYELFAARNLRQIERSLGCRIQTADMRHHNRRIDAAGCGQLERFDHIRGVAAGRAHNMRGIIVYIIKVHLGRELLVGRAREEVQTAIAAEHRAAKLNNRRNRRVAEYIIKTGAAGHFAQLCRRILHLAGVDKVQVDAVLLLDLGRREQRLSACQTVLVHIGHNDHGRTDVTVQRIRQRPQAHRTGTCHDGQLAALFNTHFVVINTHLGVISGVERTD